MSYKYIKFQANNIKGIVCAKSLIFFFFEKNYDI